MQLCELSLLLHYSSLSSVFKKLVWPSSLVLFQRMAISQAYLEKWDQKAKKVKWDLPLIRWARLGFQVRTAHQDSVAHLVLLDPLVSAWREVTGTHRNVFAYFKDSVGKAKWESRLGEWNEMGAGGHTGEKCCMLINEGQVSMVFRHSGNIWKKRKSVWGGKGYECQGVSEKAGFLP